MPLTPVQFNTRIKAAGLHLPLFGNAAVIDLAKLCEGPLKASPATKWGSIKAPLRWMGTLIQHGLAAHDQGVYSATDKGRAYLASLRENNLV